MARPGFAGAPRLIRLTSPSAHTTLRDAMLPGGSAHSQLHRVRKHRRLLLRRVSASFSCCHLLLQPPQPPPDRPEFQAVEWMVRWSSRATRRLSPIRCSMNLSIHPWSMVSKNDWMSASDRKSTRLNSSHVKISYAVF